MSGDSVIAWIVPSVGVGVRLGRCVKYIPQAQTGYPVILLVRFVSAVRTHKTYVPPLSISTLHLY